MALQAATQLFERALDKILGRVFISLPDSIDRSLAVAYSGGLDSSVLLHLAYDYAKRRNLKLFAFHVHHGLSPNADTWLAHCQGECGKLNIDFDARWVQVDRKDANGLEAAARAARYAALGAMCATHQVPLLLTAHHLDDQAETVLLQMLRGAGLPGLSGMDQLSVAPDLLGTSGVQIARPLLTVSRANLQEMVVSDGIMHIEDESNTDLRHPRNALRHQVWPLLHDYFPAFQQSIARGAQHVQSAQRLLSELARQDLDVCQQNGKLNTDYIQSLSHDRIDNLLRHWLVSHGLRMPTTSWLHEARSQLLDARVDAQVQMTHEGVDIRRYRNWIMLVQVVKESEAIPHIFQWHGEPQITFPAFGGALYFEKAEGGISAEWLRQQSLRIEYHQGGGRLKLAPNRPTRSLKDHFQAGAVPAWERRRLPVVYAEKTMVFAAGIGQDCRIQSSETQRNIQLRWVSNVASSSGRT